MEHADADGSRLNISGGSGFGGDAVACLNEFDGFIRTDNDFSQVQQVDESALLPRTGDADSAAALYTYSRDFQFSESVQYAHYVECRTLVDGEAVLVVELEVPREDYGKILPAVEELVSSLSISDVVGKNDALRGVYEDGYTNPTWGYSVKWDEATWTLEEIDHSLSYLHTAELDSATSYLWIEAEGYDFETEQGLTPANCVQEEIDALTSLDDVSNVEVSRDPADFPAGYDPSGAAVLISYTSTDEDGVTRFIDYVECRSMNGGLAVLLFYFSSNANAYETGLPTVEALLASVTMPGE